MGTIETVELISQPLSGLLMPPAPILTGCALTIASEEEAILILENDLKLLSVKT